MRIYDKEEVTVLIAHRFHTVTNAYIDHDHIHTQNYVYYFYEMWYIKKYNLFIVKEYYQYLLRKTIQTITLIRLKNWIGRKIESALCMKWTLIWMLRKRNRPF